MPKLVAPLLIVLLCKSLIKMIWSQGALVLCKYNLRQITTYNYFHVAMKNNVYKKKKEKKKWGILSMSMIQQVVDLCLTSIT